MTGPREIKFHEIQLDDTIRVSRKTLDITHSVTGVVAERGADYAITGDGYYLIHREAADGVQIELVDRPVRPVQVGDGEAES
jgi:hypothetical protein